MYRVKDIISVSIYKDEIEVICFLDKGDADLSKDTLIFGGNAISIFNCYWQYYSTAIKNSQPTNKIALEYKPIPSNPTSRYNINVASCSSINN
ncbi:hypothetical protein M5U04_20735 [Xenorhabdus sp. XENO-1]|uniref:hypothetical protein n=1 Tax=Xenorhabdus bovienii TaxID=40576 RepID=UPI0020CA642D|nr:hypothetical protein [Xenorhabdus bovienii]MCP9270427.1 hypothetical protein [Xenorhabdus bovienii subsp. africana]